MIKVITFIFSIIVTLNLFSQRNDIMLVPFEIDGQWGYKNSKLEVIVDPTYEEAFPTYENRGRIKIKGKYGFIDNTGTLIIKPKYDKAEGFYAGASTVSKNGKEYIIGTNGKKSKYRASLCGAIFRNCLRIKDYKPTIVEQDGKYGLLLNYFYLNDKKLEEAVDTIPCVFDSIIQISNQDYIFKKDGKYGHYNSGVHFNNKADVLSSIRFEYEDVQFFQYYHYQEFIDQYFAVKKNEKWGYCTLNQYRANYNQGLKKITEYNYLTVTTMCSGYAYVEYEEGKFGWISSSGVEYFRKQ